MSEVLLSLLIVPLVGWIFALFSKKNDYNSFHVCLFILSYNILTVLFLLSQVARSQSELTFTYLWLESSKTEITFGANILSLLLTLGVYMSILIGFVGLTPLQRKSKTLTLLSLFFIWSITGLFMARDLVSFYVFFVGMLPAIFMLLGMFGNVKKPSMLNLFFILNFAGALCLLLAMVLLYKHYHGNVLLENIALTDIPEYIGICVWFGGCIAFMSRVPIWPVHYWIASISASIKNPVAYIVTSIFPLTGVWGCLCFWNTRAPIDIKDVMPLIVVFGVLTMFFIALIGLANKDFIRKLFSYSTIYYLFFLLCIIILDEKYRTNMIYSLFIFLIVHASLVVLDLIANNVCEEEHCNYHGILHYMPKLSRLFTFFVFIAAGLPISSMFWNNFVLLSALFRRSFVVGIWCISTITVIGMSMLYELYMMYDAHSDTKQTIAIEDISDRKQAVFMMVILLLFLSFFNPLWFVF